MAVTEYIGPLVGPVFADPAEWTPTRSYEALTIVLNEGNSYTARQDVPIGVQLTNTDYWLETGNFNGQLEGYRKEVLKYSNQVDNVINYYPTLIAAQEDTNLTCKSFITKGRVSENDNGGGFYVINDNLTPNGMDIIQLKNHIAVLMPIEYVTPEQLANTITTIDFSSIFERCFQLSENIVCKENATYFLSRVNMGYAHDVKIIGNNCTFINNKLNLNDIDTTSFDTKYTTFFYSGAYGFKKDRNRINITIENCNFDGQSDRCYNIPDFNTPCGFAFDFQYPKNVIFDNCTIKNTVINAIYIGQPNLVKITHTNFDYIAHSINTTYNRSSRNCIEIVNGSFVPDQYPVFITDDVKVTNVDDMYARGDGCQFVSITNSYFKNDVDNINSLVFECHPDDKFTIPNVCPSEYTFKMSNCICDNFGGIGASYNNKVNPIQNINVENCVFRNMTGSIVISCTENGVTNICNVWAKTSDKYGFYYGCIYAPHFTIKNSEITGIDGKPLLRRGIANIISSIVSNGNIYDCEINAIDSTINCNNYQSIEKQDFDKISLIDSSFTCKYTNIKPITAVYSASKINGTAPIPEETLKMDNCTTEVMTNFYGVPNKFISITKNIGNFHMNVEIPSTAKAIYTDNITNMQISGATIEHNNISYG